MSTLLFEGTKIKMRDGEYTLPTLGGKAYRVGNAFDKLKEVEEAVKAQQEDGNIHLDGRVIGHMYDLTLMAFQRNYPEMDIDFVEDSLDLDGIMMCFPLLVSQDKEKIKKGLEELAKNGQKQSTKKDK